MTSFDDEGTVTATDIERLREFSLDCGDVETVDRCDRALEGDPVAWRECESMLRE